MSFDAHPLIWSPRVPNPKRLCRHWLHSTTAFVGLMRSQSVREREKRGKREGWPKPPFKFCSDLRLEVELRRESHHELARHKFRLASGDVVLIGRRDRVNLVITGPA